jgi:hypothetical protein
VFSHFPEVQATATHQVPHIIDGIETKGGDEEEVDNDSDSERDNDGLPMIDCTEEFGSSTESLVMEFEEMYDSEVELDYEN